MTAKAKNGSLITMFDIRWNEEEGCMEYFISKCNSWSFEKPDSWCPVFSKGREARESLHEAYAGWILERDVLKC